MKTVNHPAIEGLLDFYLETKNQPRNREQTLFSYRCGLSFLWLSYNPRGWMPSLVSVCTQDWCLLPEHLLPSALLVTDEVASYPSASLLQQMQAGQRIEELTGAKCQGPST